MTRRGRQLAALAAAVLRADAERVVARATPALGGRIAALARELSLRPREERLAALAAALAPPDEAPARRCRGTAPAWLRRSLGPPAHCHVATAASTARTPVRRRGDEAGAAAAAGGWHAPWKEDDLMALPFTITALTRGYALLTPSARAAGAAASAAVSACVARHLSTSARMSGRALPAPFTPSLGVARVTLALDDPPGFAVVEVEVAFLARVLARLAGTPALVPAALEATPGERNLLDLLALVALDAAAEAAPGRVRARLSDADAAPGPDALVVALDLQLGDDRGSARLVVPAPAVAALAGTAGELAPATAALGVGGSLREGSCTLTPGDLSALAPGDVLLLDEGGPRAALVLPGGLALQGRLEGDLFHVQEIRMTETQAAFPITVAVEIARVTVTLGELARLEPGAALPLDVRKDGAVVLRAGERVIARGQLVEIDGALGVRVVELGESP